MATGNRRDQELDIILVSSKDGAVVRNLTPGFDMDRGYEYIAYPSGSNMVRVDVVVAGRRSAGVLRPQ